MIVLLAGYPATVEIQVLPNPQLSNQAQVQDERDYRISMDKTVHSYVKTTPKRMHIFSFLTTREVAAQFELFIQHYAHLQWGIIDHHDTYPPNLVGHLINNPIQITYSGLFTEACVDPGEPIANTYSTNERASFELEFEA